jgi:hypothetical protein
MHPKKANGVEAKKSVPTLGAEDGTEPVAQPATLRNGVKSGQ